MLSSPAKAAAHDVGASASVGSVPAESSCQNQEDQEDTEPRSIHSSSLLQASSHRAPALYPKKASHVGGEASAHVKSCVQMYATDLDGVQEGLGDYVRRINFTAATTSDREIVFGAGSGTTGTRSVHAALHHLLGMRGWHYNRSSKWTQQLLDTLGRDKTFEHSSLINKSFFTHQCHSSLEKFDFTSLPEDVEYVLDGPVDQLFIHLFLSFPNAKFILTTRPVLAWAAKRRQHKITLAPLVDPCGQHVEDYPDDQILGQLEELKQRLVRCIIPKNRLLEFSVFTDREERISGITQELANFVGIPATVSATQAFPLMKLLALDAAPVGMLQHARQHAYSQSEIGGALRKLAQQE